MLIAAFLVGLQFPIAKLPMLGVGALAVRIGAGLWVAARAIGRYRLGFLAGDRRMGPAPRTRSLMIIGTAPAAPGARQARH